MAELRVESERLLLRPFMADDLAALHAIQSREDVTRWLYWGPRDEDEVRAAIARKIERSTLESDGDLLSFAIVLKQSGELIGEATLFLLSAQHRQGELGFIVHPDQGGRGYATEAARLLLELAFERFGLHRVIGRLEPRNTGSARVLEKLGMRREAHLVENEFVKGEWQSEAIYALLQREWSSRP